MKTYPSFTDTPLIKNARDELSLNFHHQWELNDRGHRMTHFEDVFQCAMYINKELDLGHPEINMLFAGYFHDLFAWTRINHHELAYQYFMTADHPVIVKYFGPPFYEEGACRNKKPDRLLVALACRQHRASYKGQFSNQFAELINSADRGFPKGAEVLLNRVLKHKTDTLPGKSVDELMSISIEFLKSKAGSQGYARYPDLYLKVFGEELKEQMAEIDQL